MTDKPIKQSDAQHVEPVTGARFGAFGFEFAGTIVAAVISGYYVDGYLGVAPLFTLLFTMAGMGGALYRLLWNLKQTTSHRDDGN